MYVDTHCHLDFPVFEKTLASLFSACHKAGVKRFIIPSVGGQNWQRVSNFCQRYPNCLPAFGLHPCFLDDFKADDLSQLKSQVLQNQPVAIGEIGLDATMPDMALQERVFKAQLNLALDLQLPVLLHSRKTHDTVLHILKSYSGKLSGIIHGFSGSAQQALAFYRLGFKLGVGGVITYERANKTQQAIASLPLDALVLETDSPDMPVSGQQGETNSPLNLPQIFNALVGLRKEPESEILSQLWNNSVSVFPQITSYNFKE